jgi:hypothetical protein
MSSSIWTRCAGESEISPLVLRAWRVVEAQHQVATRKLVDTAQEQELLEQLIDGAKPPPRNDARRSRLHYLLTTPFRYPPLRHGSRFGAHHERGIWYGSEALRSALAEIAYYRLLFLEGTHARIAPLAADLTAFSARTRTRRGVDLTAGPFSAHRIAIASPTSYAATQPLGAAMRAAAVEVFRYPSARDPNGVNVGVLSPAAFRGARPRELETWRSTATRDAVELVRRDYFGRAQVTFAREEFLVQGRLPAPGLASTQPSSPSPT